MTTQEVRGPEALGGGGAVEHCAVFGTVGQVAREQIRDPEADGRVEDPEYSNRERMPGEAMHHFAAPVLLGQSVPMRQERALAAEIDFRLAAMEVDAEVAREERAAPAVVIAAHERDRNAARPSFLEFRDGGKMFAGDHAP